MFMRLKFKREDYVSEKVLSILFYKELILYFRRPNLMNLNRVAELPTAGLNLRLRKSLSR